RPDRPGLRLPVPGRQPRLLPLHVLRHHALRPGGAVAAGPARAAPRAANPDGRPGGRPRPGGAARLARPPPAAAAARPPAPWPLPRKSPPFSREAPAERARARLAPRG